MKQNIKLFFTSLISNNACIDAGRKKPWYAAILLFFFSIILSVVPSTVLELKKQGDKNFDSTTYLTNQAVTQFAKDLQESEFDGQMIVVHQDKEAFLSAQPFEKTYKTVSGSQEVAYSFTYCAESEVDAKISQYNEANASFFIFTSERLYISIINPSDPSSAKRVLSLSCLNAYKKVGENEIKESFVAGEDLTDSVNKTWANWKVLIRKFYNQTRLKAAAVQLGIMSAINVGIVAIMGFMVWVLTRGKNNPYRIFTVWESYKIVFWAAVTPALLTCGLGFLIKTFASTLFPLLLGVRVMWLSMKSLRPDGSGYASN